MRRERQSSIILVNVLLSMPSVTVTSSSLVSIPSNKVKFVAVLTVISHISRAFNLALDRVWAIRE